MTLPLLALAGLLFGGRVRLLAAAILVLLAFEGAARLLDRALSAPPAGAGDAIIVLPGDLPAALDPGAVPPSIDTIASLRTAAELARRTGLPILVVGARTWGASPGNAAAMAESLRTDFGTPARWVETDGANLWQAAAASASRLHADGIGRAYIVAEPFRLRVAATLFRQAGVEITPAPVAHPPRILLDPSALGLSTTAWISSAEALEQWAALACNAFGPCRRRMVGETQSITPDPS